MLPPSAAASMQVAGVRRNVATSAVLLALVLSAFEGTVVTSAMPTIARDLGGLDLYAWIFSGFLVANMLGVLVAGKLADAFGRRPIYAAGMAIFLGASVGCGAATSISALLFFRALQGLGAGAIQPIAMTVSSDLYSLSERARVQALFTSAWGISAIVGPIVGGFLVAHVGWRSVFLVNVPIGVLAVALLLASYRDPPRKERELGLRGALLGGLAVGLAIVALEPRHASGAVRGAVVVAALVATLAFVQDQRRSSAPLVAKETLRAPVVHAGLVASAFAGGMLHACAAWVPLWITESGRTSPVVAGVSLLPLLLGWSLGSTFGVKILLRHGMRATVFGGFAIASLGAAALTAVVQLDLGPFAAMAALGLLGVGIGPAASTSLIAPQNHVSWEARGSMTSAIFAARALGGSIAIAALSGFSTANALSGTLGVALLAATTGALLAPLKERTRAA